MTHPAIQPNGECADPRCECHALATADVRDLPRLTTTRTFSDLGAEWRAASSVAIQTASLDTLATITDLALLGNRLLLEANLLGQREAYERRRQQR
jgi:hypothetical protein